MTGEKRTLVRRNYLIRRDQDEGLKDLVHLARKQAGENVSQSEILRFALDGILQQPEERHSAAIHMILARRRQHE